MGDYVLNCQNMKMDTNLCSNDPRPFCCENCGRQFSTSAYLSQHRRIHSGVKPYSCRFCDRKFTQLSHVQQHERIHTGEKPYSCVACLKSFTQMSNLHSHQRQHMKNKPCKCPHCYMGFDMQRDLENHVESKHSSNRYTKVLMCPVCSKMYNSETYLTKHIERHDYSSKSADSPLHKNPMCSSMKKYRRHCPMNNENHIGEDNKSQTPSQSVSFPSPNTQISSPGIPIKDTPFVPQSTEKPKSLDLSKSIVNAASGLRLDFLLGTSIQNLASTSCPSPLVTAAAAASVWSQSWLPSTSDKTLKPITETSVPVDCHQSQKLCFDFLSFGKSSKSSSPQSLMKELMERDSRFRPNHPNPYVASENMIPLMNHMSTTGCDPMSIDPMSHMGIPTTAFSVQ